MTDNERKLLLRIEGLEALLKSQRRRVRALEAWSHPAVSIDSRISVKFDDLGLTTDFVEWLKNGRK